MYFHAQFHYNSRSEIAHTLHILNTKKREAFHIFLGPIGLFWSIKQFEKKGLRQNYAWLQILITKVFGASFFQLELTIDR